MRQAVSADTKAGVGAKPAGGLDPRPQFPQRAEFRDGEKLICIGRKAKEDHAPRDIEGDAFRFERAQIGKGDGKNERQFLRLRTAGIVNNAAVGDCELAAKTVAGERSQSPGEMRRLVSSTAATRLRHRDGADRIVAYADAKAALRRRKALRQHRIDDGACLWREIKLERGAGTEVETFEHARHRGLACRQSEAIFADRAGKDERQAAGAGIELAQRNFVAKRRVGMIDPRQYLPCGGAGMRHDRPGVGAPLRQRRDGKAVIGGADQTFERRAFEHLIDKAAPFFRSGRREIGGEQQVFGVSHAAKCHAGRAGPISPDMMDEPPRQDYCGGSLLDAAYSTRASASLTFIPAINRSGAISASGTSTKARSSMRG